MNRTYWTKELVKEEIKRVMAYYQIDRMPSLAECDEFTGNASLSNRITREGGFYKIAEEMGLEIKPSETGLGYQFEKYAAEIIQEMFDDTTVEMTPTRFPYDLLVDGKVKIDVKVARRSKVHGAEMYSFGLAKKQPTCDIYIAFCIADDKTVEKVYVIPAHIMTGKSQLALGIRGSMYDTYLNRFNLIKRMSEVMDMVALEVE